jgi:hypothetical protein
MGHRVGNQVERAYRRTDVLEKRRDADGCVGACTATPDCGAPISRSHGGVAQKWPRAALLAIALVGAGEPITADVGICAALASQPGGLAV